MSKPVIFTVSAMWDDDAKVWSGHCGNIPAAADAATLDELLAKISRMALELAPDNHPGVPANSIFIQIGGKGADAICHMSQDAGVAQNRREGDAQSLSQLRLRYSSNIGTVNAMSPCAGL